MLRCLRAVRLANNTALASSPLCARSCCTFARRQQRPKPLHAPLFPRRLELRSFGLPLAGPHERGCKMADAAQGKRARADKLVVAVVAPSDGAVVKAMPDEDRVEFVVHNTAEDFAKSPRVGDASVLVFVAAGGDVAVLDAVWEQVGSNVKWVHSFFAGVDALAPFIKRRLAGTDVPLTNGKGAFSESLGEWAMTAVLHFNKQVPRVLRNRAEKKWDKFVMNTVAGKTLGVVGFGDIGKACARAAKLGFGMKVLALRNNPDRPSEHADEVIGPDGKLDLFRRSDFVVCALPGTPETTDFCGAAEFEALGPDGVFISIGRGLAVDEDALARALASGSIAGAAVDVFKKEPLPEDSPLWDVENILLTSHNADFTEDYFNLGWSVFEENLRAFRAGKSELPTAIAKSLGY